MSAREAEVAELLARGRVRFLGLELLVAPGALVPREETELLGATALELLRAQGNPTPWVIDMCTGSGNLACAIAHNLPGARVWASDLTTETVALARRNVEHLRLEQRLSVAQGDLFGALEGLDLEGRIDCIVCNPPYISQKRLEGERGQLLQHEPREAFDGGPYGISIHQRLLKDAARFLRVGGWLLCEFGLGQDRQLQLLFERARCYEEVRLVSNQVGEARVALGRLKAAG